MRDALIILLLLIVWTSCNSKDKAKPTNLAVVPVDTVSIDTAKLQWQQQMKMHLHHLAISLKLPPVNLMNDSFALRLWTGTMFVENDLIMLAYKNGIWQSGKFRYSRNDKGVGTIKKIKIKGELSINSLVDSLKLIDFTNLPSQEEIKDFRDNVADGITYLLEISDKRYYKLLIYHCPEHYIKSEENNRRFLDIIYLLDRHFHFYSPICTI